MPSTQGARSRKRTAKQAIQGDVAKIGAIQQQRGRRTRQFQKEAGSYRGATAMAINAVQGSNLGGLGRNTPEGRQLAQEYRGRIRSLRQSLPFTLAPVQRDYKSDIQGLNTDLAGARMDLQQHQQDRLAAIQDVLRAQQQNAAQTQKHKATKQEIDLAVRKAVRLIKEQGAVNTDPNAKPEDKRPHALPSNPLEWKEFEQAVASGSDVSNHAAMQAVRRLQKMLAGKRHDLFVNPPKYLQGL